MNDAGYTLSEMLAAMLVLGLATGGLAAGLHVFGRSQSTTSASVATLQAERSLQQLLQGALSYGAPYRSDELHRFTGETRSLTFDCGVSEACSAKMETVGADDEFTLSEGADRTTKVRLRGPGQTHFVYYDTLSSGERWPASSLSITHLKAVAVVRRTEAGEVPIAQTHFWREHTPGCTYDAVSGDCR